MKTQTETRRIRRAEIQRRRILLGFPPLEADAVYEAIYRALRRAGGCFQTRSLPPAL